MSGDIIILHICTINDNHDVWLLRYEAPQRIFFFILGRFLSFYLPMDPEHQNFEKVNKTFEDIMILKMCTINDSHMMYGS